MSSVLARLLKSDFHILASTPTVIFLHKSNSKSLLIEIWSFSLARPWKTDQFCKFASRLNLGHGSSLLSCNICLVGSHWPLTEDRFFSLAVSIFTNGKHGMSWLPAYSQMVCRRFCGSGLPNDYAKEFSKCDYMLCIQWTNECSPSCWFLLHSQWRSLGTFWITRYQT